ncbi:MAG: cobalt ECF transporter T component CbiQ [Anaerolineae bacterium]|nr:cobalt ECF transporter T component CbiQ [Anaerolineae bacterium]
MSQTKDFPQPNTDARVKLILTLAMIFALGFTPHGSWPAYVLFFSLVISAAVYFQLRVMMVLRRALVALPFILAALPLIFAGPPPIQQLPLAGGWSLPFSPAGAERFVSIALKSYISVQAAIILTAVTPTPDLLRALHHLRVPRTLVVILSLMAHYLVILKEEALRLLHARQSRSSRLPMPTPRPPGGSLWWRGQVTGGMAGNLLLRSLERSERVYAAMCARGYNGKPPFTQAAPLSAAQRGVIILGIAANLLILLTGILIGES